MDIYWLQQLLEEYRDTVPAKEQDEARYYEMRNTLHKILKDGGIQRPFDTLTEVIGESVFPESPTLYRTILQARSSLEDVLLVSDRALKQQAQMQFQELLTWLSPEQREKYQKLHHDPLYHLLIGSTYPIYEHNVIEKVVDTAVLAQKLLENGQ